MDHVYYAVLIDTVSIQKYVFGSNKLKENLGASFLIQEVYKRYLSDAIRNIGLSWDNLNAWKDNPHVILIKNGMDFEAGYIGGGNALLFFREKSKAASFINEWTKYLLVKTPGIVTAMACEEFNLDEFPSEIKKLFIKLQENKFKNIPQTVLPRHGITAECSHTGYSMDIWNDMEVEEKQSYVSSVAYAKLKASKEATENLEKEFSDVLNNKYCFTDELDSLGQSKGEESHIAIVHIDGNGMGKRFKKTTSLEQIRCLSITVEKATKKSFELMLNHIISEFGRIEEALGFDEDKKYPEEDSRKILPLRPIIIGGDDITFVCDGRLGIYFARMFMEFFETQTVSDNVKLSACAGIAITKTKYPFYRGYEIAEQLCQNAKKEIKEGDSGSWLDFHIAFGGFSGSIEEIRESHYKSSQGSLFLRPYKINSTDAKGMATLIDNTKKLMKFPRSKIKELRQVLAIDKVASLKFVAQMKSRGLEFPVIQGRRYEETLFIDGVTPYFDMIELMEFYPSFELTGEIK